MTSIGIGNGRPILSAAAAKNAAQATRNERLVKASDQRLSGPARRFDIAFVLDPVGPALNDDHDPGEAATHLLGEGHLLIHGIVPAVRRRAVSAAIAATVTLGRVHAPTPGHEKARTLVGQGSQTFIG